MNAVLFDLDGTLWDACAAMTVSWNRTLAEKFPAIDRRVTVEVMESFMGKTLREIAALFLPDQPAELAQRVVLTACDDEVSVLAAQGGTLYAGVAGTLRRLAADYRVGIVSNCQCGYIEAFLAAHHLTDCVHGILCEGMTHFTKGENIALLKSILAADNAVYVGDTAGDEAAARAAGVPFIHAAYGFGTAAAPDAVLRDFSDLPELLPRFLKA